MAFMLVEVEVEAPVLLGTEVDFTRAVKAATVVPGMEPHTQVAGEAAETFLVVAVERPWAKVELEVAVVLDPVVHLQAVLIPVVEVLVMLMVDLEL